MNGSFSYSQINFFMSFNFFFYDRVKMSVHCIVFSGKSASSLH
jgi:hypothetical protein